MEKVRKFFQMEIDIQDSTKRENQMVKESISGLMKAITKANLTEAQEMAMENGLNKMALSMKVLKISNVG